MIAPAGGERAVARVTPTADGPRFAWLQLVPAGPPVNATQLNTFLPAAGFLGALTGGRPSLAVDLLTPAARARLAPPRDDAEKAPRLRPRNPQPAAEVVPRRRDGVHPGPDFRPERRGRDPGRPAGGR